MTSPKLSRVKQLKMEVKEEIEMASRMWKLEMRMKYRVLTLQIFQKSYGMSKNTDKPRNFNIMFKEGHARKKIYMVIFVIHVAHFYCIDGQRCYSGLKLNF